MSEMKASGRVLAQKISKLADLDPEDTAVLSDLSFLVERRPTNSCLVREGARIDQCCLLIEGFAARHKTPRSADRQVVSFHMAGDILNLENTLWSRADHSIQTVSPATVGWIADEKLKALISSHPNIAKAFARDTLIDASIFREWVVNVGRRDAKSRVAHIICEFVARSEAIGLASIENIVLPFTQTHIGDATGLTAVHVNRMLQALTKDGAFCRAGLAYKIGDWEKLKKLAGFDPAYPHLNGAARESVGVAAAYSSGYCTR